MGKFDQFTRAALKAGKLVPYTFHELTGQPRVLIEHLGPTNATFMASSLAKAKVEDDEKQARRQKRKESKDSSDAELDAANRKFIAEHIVRRLDDVTHADGTKATDDDLVEFCESLPDYAYLPLLKYARDYRNFVDTPIEGDVNKLAKK